MSKSEKFFDQNTQFKQKKLYLNYQKKEYEVPKLEAISIHKTGCLTCGCTNNVVQFFGERHVCRKCRGFLQDPTGKPIRELILTQEGIIVALVKEGLKLKPVDPNNLVIFDLPCMATFASPKVMVVILKEKKKEHTDQRSFSQKRGKKGT